MKTDEWIELLARSPAGLTAALAGRRFAAALGWAAAGALLLMAVLLGVRADIANAATGAMFWVKLLFGAAIAGFAWPASMRLGRPGAPLGVLGWGMAAPFVLLWAIGAVVLVDLDPLRRDAIVFGRTWRSCTLLIGLLSLPGFVALLWALRGLAPTRPAGAGACAGLAAGGVAATVYALHCPETDAPFLAAWYAVGVAIPALAGALVGPRVLRW